MADERQTTISDLRWTLLSIGERIANKNRDCSLGKNHIDNALHSTVRMDTRVDVAQHGS